MTRTCGNVSRPKTGHRRDGRQAGTILVMVAILMLALIAFMGLAFDASYMYYYKRRVQTAADAGAIAGAQELLHGRPTEVTIAARKDAQLNRFTHGVGGITVEVNNPPLSGTRVGQSSFVEVIVAEPRPTWFMNIVGVSSATVRARAVAGLGESQGCVYALNRDTSNSNNGIFANGTTNSTFSCGVFSNANFRTTGGGCIVAPSASYSGTYVNSGSGSTCGPAEVGHGVPVADPMEGRYTLPATSPCSHNNYRETSGTNITLTPGVYCGGIDLGGSLGNVTFSPGTYVLAGGGLRLGSSVNATGTGVTFFNTFPGTNTSQYREITINTSGNVALSAPTSGANKALLFYQDPRVAWASNNGSTITGSSTSTFNGILYFPTTDLTYSGNSSSTSDTAGYTFLVAYNLKISGSAQVHSDYTALGGSSPFQVAAFAE
jgi:Flp pilus assembly protein TadG